MTYGMPRVRPRSMKNNIKVRVYLIIVTVTVFFILHLSAHVFVLSLQDRVTTCRNERINTENEIKNLEIEVAGLKKGSRIIAIATEHLGLEMPVGAPEKLF